MRLLLFIVACSAWIIGCKKDISNLKCEIVEIPTTEKFYLLVSIYSAVFKWDKVSFYSQLMKSGRVLVLVEPSIDTQFDRMNWNIAFNGSYLGNTLLVSTSP